MNNDIKRTRIFLEGIYSPEIAVNEKAKAVVAELIVGEETTFIYAEKIRYTVQLSSDSNQKEHRLSER